MRNCLYCKKEFNFTNKRQVYCCINCKNYAGHKRSGYKAQKEYRSRSVRNYLGQLRSYYNRKETLSLDFLLDLYNRQEGKCAVTGEVMTHLQNSGRNPTNLSIDRIDSSKGYEPENVRLVCYQVNVMKQDYDDEVLKDWCRKILNIQRLK